MKLWNHLSPLTRRNLVILFVAGLLFWSSLAALLPTLPLYIQDSGGTKQQIGLVMACFAIGLLLFRPSLARMADLQGRRGVLLIGLVAVAIAPGLYHFTQDLKWLMAIRAFHGLSIAAFTTAYSALVVDLSPQHQRGELIGYMSLTNPLGMAIGPALGSWIRDDWGYGWLFAVSALLGLLGTCCAWLLPGGGESASLGESGRQGPASRSSAADVSFWRLLLSPRLRVPTLLMLAVGLVFGTLSIFVPLLIADLHLEFKAGWFYTAAAMTSFGIRFPTGPASDRWGRGPFITLSLICYILAMAILSRAETGGMFVLAGLVEGTAGGMFIPMVIALMADRSGPQERARMLGLCVGGFDLGIALAGPILGQVAEGLGYRGLFELAMAIALGGLGIFLGCSSQGLRRSLAFALGRGRDLYAVQDRG